MQMKLSNGVGMEILQATAKLGLNFVQGVLFDYVILNPDDQHEEVFFYYLTTPAEIVGRSFMPTIVNWRDVSCKAALNVH